MLSYSENILQTLTGKSSLDDISEDELRKIADSYPYFGAAQFLLAKKASLTNSENHKQIIQKAALHFTNKLWLHYNFIEKEIIESSNHVSAEEEKKLETEAILPKEVNISEVESVEPQEINIPAENIEAAETAEEVPSSTQITENKVEDLITPDSDEKNTELLDEPEAEPNERISNLLKEQAAAFEKPVEETELPIEKTPPHRIDYFESQGIKLEEDKANDKLGKQLKRFTDWLKQMKRINPNNIETDEAAESKVQNMAEYSNEPKEVVTEAMAEVLIMQGKPEQAIQIYEKLSFINPSKSAYFAAKIQELKA